MAAPSVAVATYLADRPDTAWSDLHELAGDLLGRFAGLSRAELERGIAISLEIARARTTENRTPRQERIVQALTEGGPADAAALVGTEWSEHITALRGGRSPEPKLSSA